VGSHREKKDLCKSADRAASRDHEVRGPLFVGLCMAGTLASVLLLSGGIALADFNTGTYSYRKSNCTQPSDPITIVFYGYATGMRSNNHVRAHTGWSGGAGGGQYFTSHGHCGPSHRHSESAGPISSRYHIRMRQTYDTDPHWGTTTVATPHHEDFVSTCTPPNHAVDKGGLGRGQGLWSGFDQGPQ